MTGGDLAIVEDHGLIAQTLAAALRVSGHAVHVLDIADRGLDAILDDLEELQPRVTLLDLDLGDDRDGVALIARIAQRGTVLVVTGVSDPVRLARAVEAGAAGIVSKASSFDAMADTVMRALGGETLLTKQSRDEHLALLRRHQQEVQRRLVDFDRLTPREAEVLGELVRGRSVDDIATASVVSVATVRTQVRAILTKLDVASQLAATARARAAGWVPPQER